MTANDLVQFIELRKLQNKKLVVYNKELNKWYDIEAVQIDYEVLILRPNELKPR